MSSTITADGYRRADLIAEILQPAIAALEKVHANLAADNEDLVEKTAETLGVFRSKLVPALAIIAEGNKIYKNRDQLLIAVAASRYGGIDYEIESTRQQQKTILNIYEGKVAALRDKHFSDAEIAKVLFPPDDEIEALNVAINDLENERLQIFKFLSSRPAYNSSYLAGTKVLEALELRKLMNTMQTK